VGQESGPLETLGINREHPPAGPWPRDAGACQVSRPDRRRSTTVVTTSLSPSGPTMAWSAVFRS